MLAGCYLQEDGEDDQGSDAVHDAAVVRHQGLPTASRPDVELLDAVVVVVVGRVVGQVVLEAGPWRAGVTAAERNAVHQELLLHVAHHAAGGKEAGVSTVSIGRVVADLSHRNY